MLIPTVIDNHQGSQRAYDIYSRLLKDRIIVLSTDVNDTMAASIIAQLLYLDSQDSTEDIKLYINSPGGSVTAGLGIMDTMNLVKADVSTICIGQCASMGALLLSCGAKGKRLLSLTLEFLSTSLLVVLVVRLLTFRSKLTRSSA